MTAKIIGMTFSVWMMGVKSTRVVRGRSAEIGLMNGIGFSSQMLWYVLFASVCIEEKHSRV